MKPFFIMVFSGLIFFFCYDAPAQTGLISPAQDSLNIFLGSGRNQLLIPDITTNIESIFVQSANENLLEILEVNYVNGQPFAMVLVAEKGEPGTVELLISMEGNGESTQRKLTIFIVYYDIPGVRFEIHDIVFWQEAIPLTSVPVFDTIIQSTEGPYSNLNYSGIPLTVNLDCATSPPCTGNDFYTAFYRGYLVPPVSGDYYFSMYSQDRHGMWLSTNEHHNNAKNILYRGFQRPALGTETGNNRTRSGPQSLEAGKVYAFYATQWIIHSTYGGVLWEIPGESGAKYIEGEHMMPVYDIEKSTAPNDLALVWRASTEAMVAWQPSTDNLRVTGYHVYLDGYRYNEQLIRTTSFLLEALTPSTTCHLVVTAVDGAGNESFVSNTLVFETYQKDNNLPLPPDSLTLLAVTGLAVHVAWSGASDVETEVVAYNVYVDSLLYNTGGFIFSDSLIIRGLMPETDYYITIEAVDAGFNVSEMSLPFLVSTVEYDPLGPNLGERSGRIVIHDRNISWNHGMGLNVPYENGTYPNQAIVRDIVEEFGAGVVRWGAITANSRSFSGSTGTSPSHNNTYARIMNHASEIGAYFALTVGVSDQVDYMTDPATFLRLMEYLNGPASTQGGARRAAEGFQEPLLPGSPGVILEFGNEVWGGASHQSPIGSNYNNYAAWVREMSDLIRTSPYYDPEKIIMTYSGRYPSPSSSFGLNRRVLDGDRGHAECLAVSGYLGGNLNYDPDIPAGESELDYYRNGVAMAASNVAGLIETMGEMSDVAGSIKTFYLYESNMTTSSYNGRFGQAIVMTDYLAAGMRFGSIVPSIFHLTGGQWRITRPQENYRRLPLFITGKFFNRFCKGNILQTAFLSTNVIKDAWERNVAWEPVGAYAYNHGEDFAILLINRDFTGDFTVQVELPESLEFSDEATIFTIWEDDFSSFDYHIDSTDVSLKNGMFVRVPKHSMVIVAAKGNDPEYTLLPLGYFERVRPDMMTVTPLDGAEHVEVSAGYVTFQAQVFPENAFSRRVIFEVLENTTQGALIREMTGNRIRVRGSGVVGHDGYVRIRAYALDNHDLRKEFVVNVMNQGVTVSVDDIKDTGGQLFYPNPANELISIMSTLPADSRLEIYDLAGRKVLNTWLHHGYDISLLNLQPGLYIVKITKPEGVILYDKLNKL